MHYSARTCSKIALTPIRGHHTDQKEVQGYRNECKGSSDSFKDTDKRFVFFVYLVVTAYAEGTRFVSILTLRRQCTRNSPKGSVLPAASDKKTSLPHSSSTLHVHELLNREAIHLVVISFVLHHDWRSRV